MAPIPTTLRCVPSALPRSESGKEAIIMPIPHPCTIPAPMPFTTRIAISTSSDGANVAPRDATTNIAVPAMYTRLRPTTSPNRPIGSSSTLITRAYATTTHWTDSSVASKCDSMFGRAISTLPWSITEKNVPAAMVQKLHHR